MRVKDYFIIHDDRTNTCCNVAKDLCITHGAFKVKTSSSGLLDHAEKCFNIDNNSCSCHWAFDKKIANKLLLE